MPWKKKFKRERLSKIKKGAMMLLKKGAIRLIEIRKGAIRLLRRGAARLPQKMLLKKGAARLPLKRLPKAKKRLELLGLLDNLHD